MKVICCFLITLLNRITEFVADVTEIEVQLSKLQQILQAAIITDVQENRQ